MKNLKGTNAGPSLNLISLEINLVLPEPCLPVHAFHWFYLLWSLECRCCGVFLRQKTSDLLALLDSTTLTKT